MSSSSSPSSSCLSKSSSSCSSEDDAELRRGPWTAEEDALLIHYITLQGEGRWNLLAKRSGLKRTGKSCRLRWLNYLKPDVKRGNLSPEEQLLILELHFKWGNRWSKIAQHLPGRTDNEIKNYWRTRVQKQARHLNIDPNSSAFREIIKGYYMPRLVHKIEGSSPSPSIATASISDQILNYDPQNLLTSMPDISQVDYNKTLQNSDLSQFTEYQTNPMQDCCNSTSCYGMEDADVAATSVYGCYVADSNWAIDNLWNMDGLW